MKYKFIGTEQDLIDNGFEKSKLIFSSYGYMPSYIASLHRIIVDDKKKTIWLTYVDKISNYNLESKKNEYTKTNKFIVMTANKRKYGGYNHIDTLILMNKHIQDLIDKGLVEVINND